MGNVSGSFGSPGAPGFVPPAAGQAVKEAMGQSLEMMQNRYNQLGLSGSTAEQMDLGNAPSLTGGIPQEFQAVMGQLQTADLNNPGTGGGKGGAKSGAGAGLSALGALK
jgi:hypothetical protein